MSDMNKTKNGKSSGYKPASELEEAALHFHRYPHPGKLAIVPSKPLGNQRDLALAYSPGVAAPCLHIADDPSVVADYTARGNLVAVISNGTAVLGLGNIGPLASKPVMEGKAVLFKKFAGVDVFDIEVDETDVTKFCDVVAALEPTFGGINLEDIKAPECFEVEKRLRERMNIPVFHDDQHGTAIIAAAAILNGLELAGKQLSDTKIVASGAGAASIACLNILVSLGANRDNIWVADSAGVIYKGRKERMDPYKEAYAKDTNARSLTDIMEGADVFLGLSSAGILKPEMLKEMAERPMVMALANPTPEIMPEVAMEARPDAMICTGRSDYPNQVNNVLCFPFIFRGALDCGATTINEEMKLAAVQAIAELAKAEPADATAMPGGIPAGWCSGAEAVIGRDDGTVHEVALIARQHDQKRVQIGGLAHPLARQHADQFLTLFGLPVVVVDLGVDVTRADGIHVDAEPSPLHRHGLGHLHDRRLAHAIDADLG